MTLLQRILNLWYLSGLPTEDGASKVRRHRKQKAIIVDMVDPIDSVEL